MKIINGKGYEVEIPEKDISKVSYHLSRGNHDKIDEIVNSYDTGGTIDPGPIKRSFTTTDSNTPTKVLQKPVINTPLSKDEIFNNLGPFISSITNGPADSTLVSNYYRKLYGENGKPAVYMDTNAGKEKTKFSGDGAYFDPFRNEIHIDPNHLNDPREFEHSFLSELAHARQLKDQGLSGMIKRAMWNDVPAAILGKNPYTTKGTVENEAHDIIQPEYHDHLDGPFFLGRSYATGGPIEDPNKIYKATQDLPEVTVTAPRTLSGSIAKAHENDSLLEAMASPLTIPFEAGSRMVGHMISGNYEYPSDAINRTTAGQ